MNDQTRTGIFVGAAAVLVTVAMATRHRSISEQFYSDQGESFYPAFVDPLLAASLEVVGYDEASGGAKPFKVQVEDGVWTIPSHHGYPADGKEKLADTASSVMGLHKDIVASDRLQDQESLGVIDPMDDANPAVGGRGTRVILRDASGGTLSDFIVGKQVEGKTGFRFVRLPGKKRIYAVKMDQVELSTRFADWIETNLLDLAVPDISRIEVNDYSINESTGSVDSAGRIELIKDSANSWSLSSPVPGRELDLAKVNAMTSALSKITITGVRPKPEALSSDLKAQTGLSMDLPTRISLQGKGFFVSSDGRLLSNEGEVTIGTNDGVRYTLRFGEVLYGEGEVISAGLSTEQPDLPPSPEGTGPENRYLFLTAKFDTTLLPPRPVPPPELVNQPPEQGENAPAESQPDSAAARYQSELDAWTARSNAGQQRATRLNERYAPWYFVISGSDFNTIRPTLESLSKTPTPPAKTPG